MDMSGRHMSGRQMSNDMDMPGRQMSMSARQYNGQFQPERQAHMGGMRNMADRQMAERQMSGRQMVDRQMFDREMSRDNMMYGNMMNNNLNRQMTNRRMGNQQMSLPQQVVDFPQYYKRDDFGNYAYGYSNGVLEKFETGNPRSGVKGHYMYVDSNGLNQKVEYVADDQGFRIVGKDEQPHQQHSRFTRSVEPDMMRMTSSYLMNSPALMDDDMLQMQRGMYRNGMSLNNNRRMFDNVMSGNRQMYDGRMFD